MIPDQDERNNFVIQMQYYAQRSYKRITFLSGDVHCAVVGVFKTLVREKKQSDIEPSKDFRYMLNVVTSEYNTTHEGTYRTKIYVCE